VKKLPAVYVILSLVLASCSKSGTGPGFILTPDRKAALERAADSVFMTVNVPGMIAMVSAEGEKDYIIRRGVSNLAYAEPMDVNQYFRIASNTKTFTGAAVLILADEGKISLDSSISSYLPQYNIPNGNSITVRMLGNMTSGLFNYTEDQSMWISYNASNFLMAFPPDSLLAIAFRHPVNNPPGVAYDYCNTNVVLLGLLLEKITAKPASQVIQEKVIAPMHLGHTYWPSGLFLLSPYMHGYNSQYGELMDATNRNPSWGYSAGMLVSTIPDMKIWAKAVADGSLLSTNMKAERFRWVEDQYGFCVRKIGNWVGHSGTYDGYNSHMLYHSGKKITLIIVVNMDTGHPVDIFSAAFRRILEQE